MTGHFASEASGPQKLQKYILRDLYASSLGKKNFSQGKSLSLPLSDCQAIIHSEIGTSLA